MLHEFLGLTGYCGKFVKEYGKIVGPLTSLFKRNSFKWSEDADNAFNNDLKSYFNSISNIVITRLLKTIYFGPKCQERGAKVGASKC